MKKKCSVCGAPLTNEICDYCRTNHGKSEDSSPFDQSIPTNDLSEFGFDSSTDQTPSNTSPNPQAPDANAFNPHAPTGNGQMQYFNSTPPKKSKAGLIIAICAVVMIAIVSAVMLFAVLGFSQYGTHEDSPLIGRWENGQGPIFLWVFREADAVEFFDDGTVHIIEGGHTREADWIPGANGTLRVNRSRFSYSINGDFLTITDSANDSWRFNRPIGFDEILDALTDIANDIDDAIGGANIEISDIVGMWEWEGSNQYYYRFHADGTGYRDFQGFEAFEWFLIGDELHLEFDDIAAFGVDFEMWHVTLNGDVITLDSLQAAQLIYHYILVPE